MGREKDRRVKGNLQPAASSRAAELLPTSFGSFGSGDSFGAPAFGAMAEWEMAGLDGEIKVLFKRLSKRDAVTKIRALEELATHVTEADIEQVKAIVPAWVKAYNRLSVDTDRKVRELSQLVLLRILHQNKKQLAPHLRDVIGSWLCANYDPNKEVAKLAAEAFEVAFPNKRNDVLAFCQSEILSYVNENVINQTAETMSDSRYTTPEDMLAKYGRVVAGSIYILAELIEHLATTEKTKSTSQYDAILDSAKFWLLSRAELPQIRRAMYFLINTASRHAHDILQSGQRQSMVSHAFLESAFTDGEGSTQRDLREALLFYTKAFPTSWILATNKKPIAPKFLKFLRTGAHGYMNISYPYLLPLIMSLPKELLGDDTFVKDFLGSLWAGCESTSMSKPNGPILLNAYYECVLGILSHSELRPSSALTEHITKVDALRPLHFYLLGGDSAASNGKVSANDLVTLSTEHLGKMLRSSQLSRK
ncbi:hypothetical protein DFS34DRAFT_624543 [Phlyctochytrium arcticum]|nr:hypothetical protein DFS34DRAFT_624543 [Phlyctochytrium arcticum]